MVAHLVVEPSNPVDRPQIGHVGRSRRTALIDVLDQLPGEGWRDDLNTSIETRQWSELGEDLRRESVVGVYLNLTRGIHCLRPQFGHPFPPTQAAALFVKVSPRIDSGGTS